MRTTDSSREQKRSYTWLARRLILFSLLSSVLPLLVIGWALDRRYGQFGEERVLDVLRGRLQEHVKTLDLFIADRTARLHLLASTHSRADLVAPDRLRAAFAAMNLRERSITDLGIIDAAGNHLAYEGPYDLLGRNYRDAPWFAEVMERGVYVSDMFLGYRNEAHFIMAVRRTEGGSPWILRATIDTAYFRSLVESVAIGRTGEVFLVSRDGVYQTSPRIGGEIMAPADVELPPESDGPTVRVLPAAGEDPSRVVCQVWLTDPRWLLLLRQDTAEAFGGLLHTRFVTLLFVHLTAIAVLLVSVVIVLRMLVLVRRRDRSEEALTRQLITAGKLASLGELSAGVAHEINNPLGIILTERQLLLDAMDRGVAGEALEKRMRGALAQIDKEVLRCRRITHQLLRFARRTVADERSELDVSQLVREVGELVEREAGTCGVIVEFDLLRGLPPLRTDPGQLQQVLLNLVTNAVDSHEGLPGGRVLLSTRPATANRGILIRCADEGRGILPEHLDRIFDPFFTTKARGRGTGLGLSISHSIVRQLGGEISVSSRVGEGTVFEVLLPFRSDPDQMEVTP